MNVYCLTFLQTVLSGLLQKTPNVLSAVIIAPVCEYMYDKLEKQRWFRVLGPGRSFRVFSFRCHLSTHSTQYLSVWRVLFVRCNNPACIAEISRLDLLDVANMIKSISHRSLYRFLCFIAEIDLVSFQIYYSLYNSLVS